MPLKFIPYNIYTYLKQNIAYIYNTEYFFIALRHKAKHAFACKGLCL